METTSKNRTPSRCREWERQRRNKFNDAISKLGDVVKAINKANDTSGKETENVQYPKIEIIQKAIVCLTNCAQEKTQLKADILALQVRLETENNKKSDTRDASTQVFISINRKSQNNKYVKLLMLQKSRRNALKEKAVITTNVTVESKIENKKPITKDVSKSKISLQKLPKLLPRSNNDNKGPENTIVVLPAAPYIFPQRPLLFPTVPPAFVLVDPNIQTLNKSSVPVVNRNSGEVTKTTMVNILPISAYSRPLSATKTKKGNVKSRNDISKKNIRKTKSISKLVKEAVTINGNIEQKPECKILIENREGNIRNESSKHEKRLQTDKENENTKFSTNDVSLLKNNSTNNIKNNSDECTIKNHTTKEKDNVVDIPKIVETSINSDTIIVSKETGASNSLTIIEKSNIENSEKREETDKTISEKEILPEEKDKENKLPNILETTLCENVVDGGNARLELAEELLAASPTAAFLMSFPLVSGNRADSPAEEPQNTVQLNTKDHTQRRTEIVPHSVPYFEKSNANENKTKTSSKSETQPSVINKQNEQHKYINNTSITTKQVEVKTTNSVSASNVSTENAFLNLHMPSLISTSCTLSDSTFGLDFDCNNTLKTVPSESTNYVSNSNLFYKSDPFSTVKNTIYSTSSISSGHEFNGLGLYPCAMEKYTTKNKSDYANVEDNLMKIGSSRLTYDIDLGWSHKGFDFVNCTTTSNTFNKDNILTTVSAPFSTSYNPFNPEFHVSLVSSSNKKDIPSKPTSSFTETITSFYSQPTNLWSEDVSFYSNNNVSKTITTKQQNYLPLDHTQSNINLKPSIAKQYDTKIIETGLEGVKSSNTGVGHQILDKCTKKSPTKMHINWMTSEIRPMQNSCNPTITELKESHHKPHYGQLDQVTKKQDHNDGNYFPIHIHNYPTQAAQEEFQVWPSTRTLGTTEISIEPPPINLPTLVGDLALGPHDRKKNIDMSTRGASQSDIQNCSNFLSVTQLMNRSSDSMPPRYQGPNIEAPKPILTKQNSNFTNDINRKTMSSRLESLTQPSYVFNDSKTYENMGQFSQNKSKTNKTDKSSKIHKNNYSAEALIRGGTFTQKVQDSGSTKFMMPPPQRYNDFNTQDSSVAQVSHFPPILDYSDNSYGGQQFSGTTLYNSTTNTISNSFYSNFMSGGSNLMSSNYAGAPFPSEFIDYNQTAECNYTNHKYEELKMRNNSTTYHQEKVPSNYKSSRRESAAKHKLECSKKESSKKYQSKRPKLNGEIEEWSDTSHLMWQNKTSTKRHSNIMSEDLPFANYVGNQMPSQYQPEFFNSHLIPSSVQSVGHHNADRSLTSFPVTSRANFNLSTIFPEITMKVQ